VSFVESVPALWSPEPAAPCGPAATAPTCRFRLHRRGDGARAGTEQFIARVYRQHFGARLHHFMPVLASHSVDGRACAAAGYRSAVEPLFLERYLTQPVEQVLAEALGQPVPRGQIVEIGQFASQCAGEGRRLMLSLARHLVDAGFRWAVITATAELRRLLRHQRLAVLPLATAQRRCVGDEAPLWGSYYRHAPKVLAGDLLASLTALERGRAAPASRE
jgi:hypothetical protein